MKLPPELLASICAQPDDPAGYGVAGDWLSAHGEPLGELITAQLRLEVEPDPGTFLMLKRRAEALLAEHRVRWLGADLPATWRWGLVERLELTSSSPLARVLESEVGSLAREFALEGSPHALALGLETLRRAAPPRWQRLRLGGSGVLQAQLPPVSNLEVQRLRVDWRGDTAHLRELRIADAPAPQLQGFLHTLPASLERLELLELDLPLASVARLVDRQTALSTLHLEDDLPDGLAAWLAGSPALARLRHLALGGPMTDLGLDAMLKQFARFSRLETLVLYGGRFGPTLRKWAYKQLPRVAFESRRPPPGWQLRPRRSRPPIVTG